jgi:hypothetical protein
MAIKSFMQQKTLRMMYFSNAHSIFTYGIIFWDNASYSIHIFRLQTKVIQIIMNIRGRDSCKELFKKLKHFTPLVVCGY